MFKLKVGDKFKLTRQALNYCSNQWILSHKFNEISKFLRGVHVAEKIDNPSDWCSCCTYVHTPTPPNLYDVLSKSQAFNIFKIKEVRTLTGEKCRGCSWKHCKGHVI
jgi:hypothetical protein